jgi:hypothetical protein
MTTDDDKDPFLLLSKHTISMRRAFQYCREMIDDKQEFCCPASDWHHHRIPVGVTSAIHTARNLAKIRHEATRSMILSHEKTPTASVDILERPIFPDFSMQYEIPNRPCLVRNIALFAIALQWKTPELFHNWMRTVIGQETLVPVRYQPSLNRDSKHTVSLDDKGRATESPIQNMKVSDWLQMVSETETTTTTTTTACENYYLKDWHLVQWLLTNKQLQHQHHSFAAGMYETPAWLGYDLLNAFFTKFTDGDYRFVYHGPKNSSTTLHSDVLNSFSWSYNVYGVKEWTFHVPTTTTIDASTLVIRQNAGEIVFVPATWKHSVRNLEETVSINHNWITTANLDCTWDCLCREMSDIEHELHAWNTSNNDPSTFMDNWEVHENMLRGCTGLDVTAFCFMVLIRGLQILQELRNNGNEANHNMDEKGQWMNTFDLIRLSDTLEAVVNDETIHLTERFQATLANDLLGLEAVNAVHKFIEQVHKMMQGSVDT